MTTNRAAPNIQHVRLPGGCRIKVSGAIDETFDAKQFTAGVSGVVVVDLDEVTRITSYGVRAWITALAQLNHTWLGFVKCRPAIVAHFNMVTGFAGDGHILSMYLPYVCPPSGTSFEVLVDLRKHWAELAAFNPPPAQCPDSNTQAEFDDVAEGYLSFVASQPAPVPPVLVDRLLRDAAEPTGSLRISKDVLGDVTGLWLSGRLDDKDHFKRLADGLEGLLYVSCGELSFTGEEGIARLLNFLRGVQVPLMLGELPLGLADRIAADAHLCRTAKVATIDLPLHCPQHGAVEQAIDAPRLRQAIEGAPLLLFCARCEQVCTPGFDVRKMRNLLTLNVAPLTAEVIAVIKEHHDKLSQTTKTMPGISPQPVPETLQRYQIVRPLGAGGMAEVFLARQIGDGGFERAVVLKRILPGLATDAGFVEMFLQEARLASRVSHPNVVQIFDVGREAGQYFMVMELVSGWDLNAVLRASSRLNRPFPPHLAARIAADISRGLSAAHTYTDEKGQLTPIIHRDVSPHNVLVSTQGHVKLSDFGIAKAAGSLSRTPTSMMKGKPSYLAPESVQNGHVADPRVDLFAAGLIFYQLLTLVHPFRRDSDMATFDALLHHQPAPPSTLVKGLDPALDTICAQALAKDPARRYQTAQQMERDFERVVTRTGTVTAGDVARWIKEIPELMPIPFTEGQDRTLPERGR